MREESSLAFANEEQNGNKPTERQPDDQSLSAPRPPSSMRASVGIRTTVPPRGSKLPPNEAPAGNISAEEHARLVEKVELLGQELVKERDMVTLLDRKVGELLQDRGNGEHFGDEEDMEASTRELRSKSGRELYETQLSEDTFSFLITANVISVAFFVAVMVLVLKTVIYYLILFNLINLDEPANKLNIPVAVPLAVVTSQFFAFCISVFTQNDIIVSVTLLYEGYSEELQLITEGSGGNKSQWVISIVAAFLDGLLGLAATFVLIVNSGTVLDVLLNFAAVEFVSSLDESAFFLAQKGFMGRRMRTEAACVVEATFHVKRRTRGMRAAGLILILIAIMTGWAFVLADQFNGVYAPQELIVQFDDEVRPGLAAHSGFYEFKSERTLDPDSRFFYSERRSGNGFFGYCQKEKQWVFVENTKDFCNGDLLLAYSGEVTSFDIIDSTADPWLAVREDSSYASPMEDFRLIRACQEDDDCGGSDQGRCVDFRCACATNFTGMRCNFPISSICANVSINTDTNLASEFPAPRSIASEFGLVKGIQVYGRALYMNFDTRDVILFTGVRWAITNVDTGFGGVSDDKLIGILNSSGFHASNITSIDLLSEPVWFGSAQDNSLTPVDLNWFIVPGSTALADVQDLQMPTTPVRLLCSVCDNVTNPCMFDNLCLEDGECKCLNGAVGTLCQIEPGGDAVCDEFFNNPQFTFDGGDCCEATCISTNDDTCGENQDYIPAVIGFPNCRDTRLIGGCLDYGETLCYIPSSDMVPSLSAATVIPTLSANGRILVMAEPDFDTVRVFDIDGSAWVQRGSLPEGNVNSNFGFTLGIATLPRAVVARRSGWIPVFLAIGSVSLSLGLGPLPQVHVFSWSSSGTSWDEEGVIDLFDDFGICSDVESPEECVFTVKIGQENLNNVDTGITVLVSVATLDSNRSQYEHYTFSLVSGDTSWTNQRLQDADWATLSGNGRFIALYNQSNLLGTFHTFNSSSMMFEMAPQGGLLEPPNETNVDTFSSIQFDGIQLSNTGDFLAVVVTLTTINGTRSSFAQRYETDLFRGIPDLALMGEYRIDVPYSAISFSNSAGASGILLSHRLDDMEVFTTLSYDEISKAFRELSNITTKSMGVAPTKVSISEDATILANSTSIGTSVNTLSPSCRPNEMVFRMSLTLDGMPSSISWNLALISTFRKMVFRDGLIFSCDGCYGTQTEDDFSSDDTFARTIVVEEFCIPKDQAGCLGFSFVDVSPPLGPNSGYTAYLYDPNPLLPNLERDEFAFGEGSSATTTVIRSTGMCERDVTSSCGENERQFVLALVLDGFPEDTSWTLGTVSNGTAFFQHEPYSVDFADRLDLVAVCVPQNTCLNFTIQDSYGDGICCSLGEGSYTGFLNDEQVFQSDGVFEFSQSVIFGGPECGSA